MRSWVSHCDFCKYYKCFQCNDTISFMCSKFHIFNGKTNAFYKFTTQVLLFSLWICHFWWLQIKVYQKILSRICWFAEWTDFVYFSVLEYTIEKQFEWELFCTCELHSNRKKFVFVYQSLIDQWNCSQQSKFCQNLRSFEQNL